MRIDHLVINVDIKYQTEISTIAKIERCGFPYKPKWGKGTSGFKASNLWIGSEYFEMIRLLKRSGGGWREDWTGMYNEGHRGLICLFIDTPDIEKECERLTKLGVAISKPEYLSFKWCFGLLTREMPWKNAYLPFFEGAQFQLGFQQMRDIKATNWMRQYMTPNSRENGISRIAALNIRANFTQADFALINAVFANVAAKAENKGETVNERPKNAIITLPSGQTLSFINCEQTQLHGVEVLTECENKNMKGLGFDIHNVHVINL